MRAPEFLRESLGDSHGGPPAEAAGRAQFACINVWANQSRRCPLCSAAMSAFLLHKIDDPAGPQKVCSPRLPPQHALNACFRSSTSRRSPPSGPPSTRHSRPRWLRARPSRPFGRKVRSSSPSASGGADVGAARRTGRAVRMRWNGSSSGGGRFIGMSCLPRWVKVVLSSEVTGSNERGIAHREQHAYPVQAHPDAEAICG